MCIRDRARTRQTAFVDFLLEGVATQAQLFQADNLHPTAEAQPRLLDNVWRGLEPVSYTHLDVYKRQDYTCVDYPATLEGAVRSGIAAAIGALTSRSASQ